ncbi:aspartate--tRNA(Asn) ligase [Candidatus Nomurabacteria bacterium]|nr:aspartate--tRNA(Asn) ligase [Candidatus Saccharibacteria bacterium]MCB9839457.1 aspartate--tRNA(Asn) ligase [Candidatus Nomurabacteria bacterium]
MRVLSDNLNSFVGKKVTIEGWIHKKRLLGGLNFINVRDRKGLTQVLVEDKSEVEKLRGLQIGTVLKVNAQVVADERAPGGAELHNAQIEVIVPVTEAPPVEIDKPLDHKAENLDTLFEYRPIGLRNLQESAILKIQTAVKNSARETLKELDFVEFNSPKLLPGATEGGAEVFKLDYFGKEATLAQSAQFYKQIMVGVFERAFEINPTYRAELSATTRHMTEFIHIDAEAGFISFDELMEFMSRVVNNAVEEAWSNYEPELKKWNASKPKLAKVIPKLTLLEVHEKFSKSHNIDTTLEKDLRPEEEKWICEWSKKNLDSEAVFVTDWPASEAKFYHKIKDDNKEIAVRCDLLFRGVEIATGSMRENNYETLVSKLKSIGADVEHPGFKYYLMAFKYGLPPHGGFGMGLERLTQKIIGLNNVKEASAFPRDINRLAP